MSRTNEDMTDLRGQDGTDALLEKLAQLLTVKNQIAVSTPQFEGAAAPIAIKLDGTNFGLWSQVVEMFVLSKDKLGHLNGERAQPPEGDLTHHKWKIDDSIVKGWIINSLVPNLIGNFIRFPTAKEVWDAIATTFFDGNDTSQVYDLKKRVSRLKQSGGQVEEYYNSLQALWREIDFRRPNPMKCKEDIEKYNQVMQEDRVYTFLDGLDDRLDGVRADVLQLTPLPTVEQAYARVRREDMRQSVMLGKGQIVPDSMAMISKIPAPHEVNNSSTLNLNSSAKFGSNGNRNQSQSTMGIGCTHCGNSKHTKDTCFKLHGYPEWWKELKKKRQETGKARVAMAVSGNSNFRNSIR
jgi:gag-polypeptide of LTR copia-type/Retrotransposon gag protein